MANDSKLSEMLKNKIQETIDKINKYTPPEKVKKPKGAEQEIALSKFNSLLDVDELTR